MTQRIFDGHNDALLRLWQKDRTGERFLGTNADGHLDLPRARQGGMMGGIFATFVWEEPQRAKPAPQGSVDAPPAGLAQPRALEVTLAELAIAFRIERRSRGAVKICRTPAEVEAANEAGAFAMMLHMEGAEAIGPDLDELETLYAAGVRSLGLVWSRPTVFGYGVPFRFPSTPDIGEGLTDRGIALVKACNDLGVMLDMSHLNEKGFWDVVRHSRAPIVATHSNAHVLSPGSRNLTDAQMDAIRDSEGVAGLNFATFILRDDARRDPDTPLDAMRRHLDHMLEKLGPRGVALGSDFDGAVIPAGIGDAAGLPRLVDLMQQAGYGADLIDAICYRNWMDILSRTQALTAGTAAPPAH
ncbi:dipeptidase [Acuticoccus yangtzensis]|uniref:dipeptidase n=1 Tax=Acuticoccus yangtzensis TaxID=1443441 RepID=UPI0009497E63|nr:dipeptidase [Acuticoccus yangtzensis]ORE96319.1 Membrane dipeptidase [Stappia sp. 22II-S9-Z10]